MSDSKSGSTEGQAGAVAAAKASEGTSERPRAEAGFRKGMASRTIPIRQTHESITDPVTGRALVVLFEVERRPIGEITAITQRIAARKALPNSDQDFADALEGLAGLCVGTKGFPDFEASAPNAEKDRERYIAAFKDYFADAEMEMFVVPAWTAAVKAMFPEESFRR